MRTQGSEVDSGFGWFRLKGLGKLSTLDRKGLGFRV